MFLNRRSSITMSLGFVVGLLIVLLSGFFPQQLSLQAQRNNNPQLPPVPDAFQVTDLNLPDPIFTPSSFANFEPDPVVSNGFAYFKAFDRNYGHELWLTDGTNTGTTLVSDINPGYLSSNPRLLVKSGSRLFFIAQHVDTTYLWETDGVEVNQLLEIDPNSILIDVNGKLFFELADDLWVVDHNGMRKIKAAAFVNQAASFNQHLVYRDDQNILWASDGTSEGTQPLPNYPTNPLPVSQTMVDGTTFFVGDTCKLWQTQTLTNGLTLVKDFSVDGGCQNGSIKHLTVMSDTLFFIRTAYDANQQLYLSSLWRSDGTEAGTFSISDSFNALYTPAIQTLVRGDNELFFVTSNTIWKSDGTAAGTQPVTSINNASTWRDFTLVEDLLFFVADVRQPGSGVNYEVWRTDGSASGTFQVKNINPTPNAELDNNDPFSLTAFGSVLVFNAVDMHHGRELWRSDGTEAETRLVKDINAFKVPSSAYPDISGSWVSRSEPIEMVEKEGVLFFGASADQIKGLWRTNGTSETTTLVHEINPADHIYGLETIQNHLFCLTAPDASSYGQSSLWSSTGQISQTRLLGELTPFPSSRFFEMLSQNPNIIRHRDGKTLFNIYDYVWETNGISTTLVRRMNGTVDGLPFSVIGDMLTPFKDGLIFAGGVQPACDRYPNYQLWASDADGNSPQLIKNVGKTAVITYPDGTSGCQISSSYPHGFVVMDNIAFYMIFNGDRELWRTDGTTEGSFKLAELVENSSIKRVGEYLYFVADGEAGRELWRSDGTLAGTTLFSDLYPGVGGSSPDELTVVGDTLFFTALTPSNGRELWKTDDTSQGTLLVADIAPGVASSNPTGIQAINGRLLFAADDGQTGFEPWQSDGTTAGTQLLDDVVLGPEGSNPFNWTKGGDYVYFTVEDGSSRRLWAIDLFDMRKIWLPVMRR